MHTVSAIVTLGLALQTAAHGIVTKVAVTGGKTYSGASPWGSTENKVGWIHTQNKDLGFVAPPAYGSDDIICHQGADPATAAVEVAAGGELTLTWDQWAESHHGPVLDYLAPANTDDISKIDKKSLKFVKIAEGGQTGGKTTNPPALLFASDDLRKNNLNWKVKIPSSIKAGIYVLRHEIIALHAAEKLNEAQNYPQCITLKVTGSGTVVPTGGVPATSFYKATDPGINYNLYWDVKPYQIPGPALWSGAGSSSPATATSPTADKPAVSPVVKAENAATNSGNGSTGNTGYSNQGSEVDPSSQGTPSEPSSAPVKESVPAPSAPASPSTSDDSPKGHCGRRGKGRRKHNERRHSRDMLAA